MPAPLPRSFYDRDVVQVARDLLGKRLVREAEGARLVGRIVEVEAYLARNDPANHAHRGQTRRNAAMFGPPGHAYVYAIHARFCLNVVTEPVGVPSAVLIRAVQPLSGLELMQERRRTTEIQKLASGPARLCEALGIDRRLDGWDLTRGSVLWLAAAPPDEPPPQVGTTTRVGITAARELPLRFFVVDSPFVSRPSRHSRRAAGFSPRGDDRAG